MQLPPHVTSLLAQATRLRQSGRVADSITPLREAGRSAPFSWAIQHDLGLACLECGRLPEAVAALQRAVAGNPKIALGHWRLGIALQQQGKEAAAINAYRTATGLLPSLADAHFRLATLLEALGHRTEAVASYRRAAGAASKTSLSRIAAARAFLAEGRDADGERVLRQTLALDPLNATAHEMLGTVLADAGDFEAARGHYDTAITQAPHMAGAYYDLVRCRRVTPGDSRLIERMQASLAGQALEPGQTLKLHLAIGKAADDLGDYRLAMAHFDAADGVRSTMLKFDLPSFERRVAALADRFTPTMIARANGDGCPDATPVFVVGMPRSGTTLVEQIISSHAMAAAGGELHFWNRRGVMMEQATGTEPDLAQLATDYLAFVRRLAPAAVRITDKMPMNFMWAGLMHLALPKAVIIHCRRLAIDTALSIHQTHFSPRLGFPTGGTDLVGYYRGYLQLMAHWRAVLPQDRFIEVDYETLTADPDGATRRMIAAIGLPWDGACLRPQDNQRIIKTASKWQARQPVYRTAVEKWRNYQPHLGPLAALAP